MALCIKHLYDVVHEYRIACSLITFADLYSDEFYSKIRMRLWPPETRSYITKSLLMSVVSRMLHHRILYRIYHVHYVVSCRIFIRSICQGKIGDWTSDYLPSKLLIVTERAGVVIGKNYLVYHLKQIASSILRGFIIMFSWRRKCQRSSRET